MKLTIDRADWLTGTALKTMGDGSLCDPKSKQMCCLGFLGLKLGYSKSAMKGGTILTAFERTRGVLRGTDWLETRLDAKDLVRFNHTGMNEPSVENALACVNDRNKLHPIRREAAIQYLFKKYGMVDVVFTGSYAAGTAVAKAAIQ